MILGFTPRSLLARIGLFLACLPSGSAVLTEVYGVLSLRDCFWFLAVPGYLVLAATWWFSIGVAAQPTSVWLSTGVGLFVIGWIFQFVGHYYEGRKPAFVDDLVGLFIGPLFVVAEVAFAMGLRPEVLRAIEATVGPTHLRQVGLDSIEH